MISFKNAAVQEDYVMNENLVDSLTLVSDNPFVENGDKSKVGYVKRIENKVRSLSERFISKNNVSDPELIHGLPKLYE